MTAAQIRASAAYRARRKAELARYREALEEISGLIPGWHEVTSATEIARVALQGDKA